MDLADALSRSIAALDGITDDAPDWTLVWDGFMWSRVAPDAAVRVHLDAFMQPIPVKAIAPGWYVTSRTLRRAGDGDDDRRGGICVDVIDQRNTFTGEVDRAYVCVEEHDGHIYRLDIHEADVRRATPDSNTVAQTLASVHKACVKHRFADCDLGWLATTVIPMLHRLQDGGR